MNNKSIKRYFTIGCCLCIAALLLASCQNEVFLNELPDGALTGRDGNITFVLNDEWNNEDDDATRSGNVPNVPNVPAPETVVIPTENGLLYATLSANPADATRATRPLDNGVRLVIVAYEKNGSAYDYAGDATYSISAGALIRESGNGTPFGSLSGDYKFVAYSYNKSAAPPAYAATLPAIEPANDLMWGETTADITVVNGIATASITLKHLFSRVVVVATTSGTTLAAPSITIPCRKADLTTEAGTLSDAGAATRTITFPAPASGSTITSDSCTVFMGNPAADSVVVNIQSITIGGNPKSDFTALFKKKLQAGVSYTLTLNFKDGGTVKDTPLPDTYVGAFWKHDQTGERLIRIGRPNNGAGADGAWSAAVLVGADWIKLDRTMTNDVNVGWRTDVTPNEAAVHNGNDAGFDAAHPVPGSAISVGGTLRASSASGYETGDEYIYFRIGLQSTVPSDSVRYGVVVLSYNNNSKTQRIWIRQGEEADYLMAPGDPGGGNYNQSTRPLARKFTSRNLTATTLNAQVNKNDGTPGSNASIWTDYPTQGGAYFQWMNPNGALERFAWDATTPLATNINAGWDFTRSSITDYWDSYKAENESCPPGYRRPNDGTTNANSALTVASSEFRQSLYLNPKNGKYDPPFETGSDVTNSVHGYYADGFFDRREIVGVSIMSRCAVAVGSKDVAYIGRLFFNPTPGSDHSNASIFFPAAGRRHGYLGGFPNPASGGIINRGVVCWIWSSSSIISTDHNGLHMFGDPAEVVSGMRLVGIDYANSIRCVKDEPVSNITVDEEPWDTGEPQNPGNGDVWLPL